MKAKMQIPINSGTSQSPSSAPPLPSLLAMLLSSGILNTQEICESIFSLFPIDIVSIVGLLMVTVRA